MGDYLYPDLELPEPTNYSIGKYGKLHLEYLKKHRRGTYGSLLMQGKLNEYLHGIDVQATELLNSVIVESAKENGINVGWSNPCIEIWFHAYWETMPAYIDSQNCCSGFDSLFTKKVGHPYNKNDTQIYNKICCYGNESKAIKYAKTRHTNYDEKAKPSKMNPCTTVYLIVEEINSKL